jgi:hypothetical protein
MTLKDQPVKFLHRLIKFSYNKLIQQVTKTSKLLSNNGTTLASTGHSPMSKLNSRALSLSFSFRTSNLFELPESEFH